MPTFALWGLGVEDESVVIIHGITIRQVFAGVMLVYSFGFICLLNLRSF